jgi:transposase
MKKFSVESLNSIIHLIDSGISSRKIAERFQTDRRTIDRIRNKHRPDIEKSKGGRPPKIDPHTKRKMRRHVITGKVDTAVRLAEDLRSSGTSVCDNTVRKSLRESGLKSGKKIKKPRLLKSHREKRLKFAKEHKNWTLEDWHKVIWSDETKVNRLGSDGCRYDI